MSFVSPIFFIFIFFFLIGCNVFTGRKKLWFYTGMSYLFYSFAHPPYIFLLFTVTLVNYTTGFFIVKTSGKLRKFLLIAGLTFSFAPLFLFKYSYWLTQSFNEIMALLNIQLTCHAHNFLLPVGISFYTFQASSYLIDVYRGRTEITESLLEFACFVSFFPQLVAGPIVRSIEFLPQLSVNRPFFKLDLIRGVELVIIGYFKKCVVADNCAVFVDKIYSNPDIYSGLSHWLGALFFTVQIYTDFSGYSDIARGIGRIIGFKFPFNFRWPYLSSSLREFWRRWHMTLYFWIRDYIYIPLGGNKVGYFRFIFNIIFTWFLCGLWHGAGYTYVIWGLYHGILLTCGQIVKRTRIGKLWGNSHIYPRIIWTFSLTVVGWVIFRSRSIGEALLIYKKMFFIDKGFFMDWEDVTIPLSYLVILGFIHIITYRFKYDVDDRSVMIRTPYPLRTIAVAISVIIIILFSGKQEAFIYFAF